jgi:hypothetical protein
MSDEQQQAPPPAAAPTNSAEASAVLAARVADTSWSDKLLSRDADTTREFNELTAMVAGGTSDVDVAMSGALPDVPDSKLKTMAGTAEFLRNNGFPPLAIKETLERKEATQAEFDLATALKNQHMRSPEFVKRYLSGEPDAVREMLACDVVLSSDIKKGAAA